jgi:NADP-dependent 3-hydroxy acid dehydrogenase YdfG
MGEITANPDRPHAAETALVTGASSGVGLYTAKADRKSVV